MPLGFVSRSLTGLRCCQWWTVHPDCRSSAWSAAAWGTTVSHRTRSRVSGKLCRDLLISAVMLCCAAACTLHRLGHCDHDWRPKCTSGAALQCDHCTNQPSCTPRRECGGWRHCVPEWPSADHTGRVCELMQGRYGTQAGVALLLYSCVAV